MKIKDSDLLRLVRRFNKWTLQDLSCRAGLSPSHLAKIEAGERALVGRARYVLEYDFLLAERWWDLMLDCIDKMDDQSMRVPVKNLFVRLVTGGDYEDRKD